MIKRYVKKPVEIEAVQWDGTYSNSIEIEKMFRVETDSKSFNEKTGSVYYWKIKTLEGAYIVSPHDFIIKGIKGEFYPCKPDIFQQTYEEVK